MKELIQSLISPSPLVVVGFILMLLCDLFSGVRKAKKKGEATTSKGLRRTVDKTSTYFNVILPLLIIFNISALVNAEYNWMFERSIDSIIVFCMYIEFKSILENLIEINTDSFGKKNFLCQKLLIPLHNILIFKFK